VKRHYWYVVAAVGLVAVVAVVLLALRDEGGTVPRQPALATPQNLQAVVNGPLRARVGQSVEFVGEAAGSSAKPAVAAFCFGDGPCARVNQQCVDREPAAPKPATLLERRKHTYTKAGSFKVTFEVDGGCTGYTGQASAVATITVTAR
jgi:hypothetical protein